MMITRHFVSLEFGQIHYRRAGQGPVLVLLHQSPSSSEEMAPMMRALAPDFTVIAPDNPGFGLSDPLPQEWPEIDDFAAALVEFFDALGLQRPCVYGFHTGAMIAAGLAHRFPSRVAAALMDGYVILTPGEREDKLAHYFDPPFVPQADGTHMAWVWSRFRDQSIFYPWYKREKSARMTYNVSPPEKVQNYVMGFLRAGTRGMRGYRSAFTYDSEMALKEFEAPCFLMAEEHDPLAAYLKRLPSDLPSNVHVVRFAGSEARFAQVRQIAQAHTGAAGADPAPPVRAAEGASFWRETRGPDGQKLVIRRQCCEEAKGRPVLFIHGAGGSSLAFADLLSGFSGTRDLLIPDLPGHGDTGAFEGVEISVSQAVESLTHVLEELDLRAVDVVAQEGGGQIALALARARPDLVHKIALIDLWDFDEQERAALRGNLAPPLTPLWYGGHLMEAWLMIRDSELFWPWYQPLIKNEIGRDPDLDPAALQERAVDLLKAAPHHTALTRSMLDADVSASLSRVTQPLLLCADVGSPHFERTQKACDLAPTGRFETLPKARASWPAMLLSFFDDKSE